MINCTRVVNCMLIRKECDYAIRILRALTKTTIASVTAISEQEHIPIPFAYKICKKMVKAGFISSHRGTDGGYELNQGTLELSLLDVCKAVDTDLMIAECMEPTNLCSMNTCERPCKVHNEFCRLQKIVLNEMSATKLALLLS